MDRKALHAKIGQPERSARRKSWAQNDDRPHPCLPVTRQTTLLGISRGKIYYVPRAVPESDLKLMRRIDELYLAHPSRGARLLRGTMNR